MLGYIAARPSLSVLEIGVAKGANAMRMMAFADALGGRPRYVGIDLFGSLTQQIFQDEVRTEGKRPRGRAETMNLLREQLGDEIALRMTLLEGFSGPLLAELCHAGFTFDLIFIDGGHSYEVVREDWRRSGQLLAPGGVIVLDDYPNYGVGRAVEEIDRTKWNVRILEKMDHFRNLYHDLNPAAVLGFQLVEAIRLAG